MLRIYLIEVPDIIWEICRRMWWENEFRRQKLVVATIVKHFRCSLLPSSHGQILTVRDSSRGEFNCAGESPRNVHEKPHQTLVGDRRSESSSDIDRQNQRFRREVRH